MADRRSERLAALREAMEHAHLDAQLVTHLPNVRYLTGFSGSSALVVVTRSEVLFFTDFRYATQAPEETGGLARVVIEAQSLWSGLWRLLPELGGVELIGFESMYLSHRDFERLLAAGSGTGGGPGVGGGGGARWQWRPTIDLVERLREQKDADEVARIEAAAAVATRALERALDRVRPGITELAAAGALEEALRDEGSEGFPFETIVASGPRSALPHARASAREVNAGEFLLFDFGAVVDGYCSDVTRTVVVGRASVEQRAAYEVVHGANAEATHGVRAGMRGRDADALARRYIEARGLGEAFGHSLGHGIGLEVHEAPRLARTADAVLPERAVVTIEPGVYRPGWGGVRIEDDVVLGPDGARVLTTFPRELIELA